MLCYIVILPLHTHSISFQFIPYHVYTQFLNALTPLCTWYQKFGETYIWVPDWYVGLHDPAPTSNHPLQTQKCSCTSHQCWNACPIWQPKTKLSAGLQPSTNWMTYDYILQSFQLPKLSSHQKQTCITTATKPNHEITIQHLKLLHFCHYLNGLSNQTSSSSHMTLPLTWQFHTSN